MDAGSRPRLRADSVIDALRAAAIPVVVLNRGDGPLADDRSTLADRRIQLLVPRARFREATTVVEPMPWRYSWTRRGLMRLVPGAYYWFDGGTELELFWGVPAAPLPSAVLRRLTTALWRSAREAVDGAGVPDRSTLLVYLAVRSCAPGTGHERDWARFVSERKMVPDVRPALALARSIGVLPALERALAAAEGDDGARPGPGPLFQTWLEIPWRAGLALQRRVRRRRIGRLLTPIPTLGDFAIRCRVLGVETIAERDVFVPTPDADLIATIALEIIADIERPVILDVGSGNGAIGLAIAAMRRDAQVHATELLTRSARCARRNAERLGRSNVRVWQGSLLDPLPSRLRGEIVLAIANLPFYPARGYAPVGSVPRATIQGEDDDGLGLIRRLVRDGQRYLRPDGWLVLQMFAWQWDLLAPELSKIGFRPGSPSPTGPFVIGPVQRIRRMPGSDRAPGHPSGS